MTYWIISDTHFGHGNLCREEYESRPADFEVKILKNLHAHVTKRDVLIHLGDVCVGDDVKWHEHIATETSAFRKWLVLGNHDQKCEGEGDVYHPTWCPQGCDDESLRGRRGNEMTKGEFIMPFNIIYVRNKGENRRVWVWTEKYMRDNEIFEGVTVGTCVRAIATFNKSAIGKWIIEPRLSTNIYLKHDRTGNRICLQDPSSRCEIVDQIDVAPGTRYNIKVSKHPVQRTKLMKRLNEVICVTEKKTDEST